MPNLIITRREGETLVLDERITIKVVGYKGSAVKLAIEAPESVNVRRGELPAPIGPNNIRGEAG